MGNANFRDSNVGRFTVMRGNNSENFQNARAVQGENFQNMCPANNAGFMGGRNLEGNDSFHIWEALRVTEVVVQVVTS